VPTNHTVFATGYQLTDKSGSIIYSGDTTTTDALWELGKDIERLAAVFMETSFPNRLERLALVTGHLTTFLLAREHAKLDKPEVPVKIFHKKPQCLDEIRVELACCQER
jgi:ribonuclease BN (tRNA processing enzyme)